MTKKIKVAVVMGGKSSEHEVSLISGRKVVESLDKKKYDVLPVVLSIDGSGTMGALRKVLGGAVDVVFIAMHGPLGEDGTIQGMFELMGVPYTGSRVLASALGMDKVVFRKLMEFEGIKIPKYVVVKKGENLRRMFKVLGALPYFVKPVDQGSSVGTSIVRRRKDLGHVLKRAFKYGTRALVDEYIRGKEVTVSVLGNDNCTALPVVEIKPLKNEFFDYVSKYTESGAEEIVPAKIKRSISMEVQKLAVKVYKAVGCRGFARVDFILKNNKE